jgi:hypothetical protein
MIGRAEEAPRHHRYFEFGVQPPDETIHVCVDRVHESHVPARLGPREVVVRPHEGVHEFDIAREERRRFDEQRVGAVQRAPQCVRWGGRVHLKQVVQALHSLGEFGRRGPIQTNSVEPEYLGHAAGRSILRKVARAAHAVAADQLEIDSSTRTRTPRVPRCARLQERLVVIEGPGRIVQIREHDEFRLGRERGDNIRPMPSIFRVARKGHDAGAEVFGDARAVVTPASMTTSSPPSHRSHGSDSPSSTLRRHDVRGRQLCAPRCAP